MWESAFGWLSSERAGVGKEGGGVCGCAQACNTRTLAAGRSRAALCGAGPLLGRWLQPPRAAPSSSPPLGEARPRHSLDISKASIRGMTSEALSPGKSLLLLFLH